MYVIVAPNAVRRPPQAGSGVASLGFVWMAIPAVMSAFATLYPMLFSCSNPDWVGLNFDPDDRSPRRIYGMTSEETNATVINEFEMPIANAYGISQSDVDAQVWQPLFNAFVAGGGTWGVDLNTWAGITVNFFNWLASKGLSTDPTAYFAAHDSFKVEMEASCGSGHGKRKSLVPFSQVSAQLMQKIAGQIPPSAASGTATNLSSIFSGIPKTYLIIGGIGLLLIIMANAAKRSRPQYAYTY